MWLATVLFAAIGIGLAGGLMAYLTELWFPGQQRTPLNRAGWAGLLLLVVGGLVLMSESLPGRFAPTIPASIWTTGGHSVMVLGLAVFAWGNWRAPQPRVSMIFVPLGIIHGLSNPVGYYILATGLCALAPWLFQRLRNNKPPHQA